MNPSPLPPSNIPQALHVASLTDKDATLPLSAIQIEGGTQTRADLDRDTVAEYAERMKAGAAFPRVIVFSDGKTNWMADGFHRYLAAEQAGLTSIAATVKRGGQRDAILYGASRNDEHGIRRTNADKRHVVTLFLQDKEWGKWSDQEIARRCNVSHTFVSDIRKNASSNVSRSDDRKVERGGTTYQMHTANIGQKIEPIRVPFGEDGDETELETAIEEETPPHKMSQAEKEIVSRALEIKERVKSAKREERRVNLAEQSKTFDRVASVGLAEIHCADSRKLHEFVKPDSIQLVVTSPPYNVGMPYANHDDTLSASDYAALLQSVFAECFTAMCDGARIAVVVPFGVGRHPWKPVASVVADHLCAVGFTLRGQIVWHKGTFDTSTAWGSYRSPSAPTLRDSNEAVIIANKGSDRLEVPDSIFLNDNAGRYSPFLEDDFEKLVTDFWHIMPESAERIGHPAPFPVELASRLIRLYAYPGAFILDPFSGSGSTGVAAIRLGCRAKLVDIDAGYCALARDRCNQALKEENNTLTAPGWSKAAQDAVTALAKRKKEKGKNK